MGRAGPRAAARRAAGKLEARQPRREEWREGGKGRSEGGKGARVRGREGRSEGAREVGKKDEGLLKICRTFLSPKAVFKTALGDKKVRHDFNNRC